MAVPSQPTTHSWNALPDGVAGEIFSRLTVDSSETGEVAEQIDRNDDAGTLQLMLGERSDTPPGPFRLVCQEWCDTACAYSYPPPPPHPSFIPSVPARPHAGRCPHAAVVRYAVAQGPASGVQRGGA